MRANRILDYTGDDPCPRERGPLADGSASGGSRRAYRTRVARHCGATALSLRAAARALSRDGSPLPDADLAACGHP